MDFNLTSAQVAAILHCSERTVQKLAKAGKLNGTKIGSGSTRDRFTFPMAEVERYRTTPAEKTVEYVKKLSAAVSRFQPVPSDISAKVARKRASLQLANARR